MLIAFLNFHAIRRRKQAVNGEKPPVYRICISMFSSDAEIILISSLCGRQIIGTMPPDIAPLAMQTLSGQSASTTAIVPSDTRIVLLPYSLLTVNSAFCDRETVLCSFPLRYISAAGSDISALRSRMNAAIPAMATNAAAVHAMIVFLLIFTSEKNCPPV